MKLRLRLRRICGGSRASWVSFFGLEGVCRGGLQGGGCGLGLGGELGVGVSGVEELALYILPPPSMLVLVGLGGRD